MNYTNRKILELVTHVIENDPMFPHMKGGPCLEAIRSMINTYEAIMQRRVKRKGRMVMKVVESGMDCDCVKYDGRVYIIDATLEALDKLHGEIADWADGPFALRIVDWSEKVEYHSRDLALEAHENGHPHHIVG